MATPKIPSLGDIIKSATEQARLEKEAALRTLTPPQEKVAAAETLDVGDIKVALELAKAGRDLAASMKKAEEATSAAASTTGGPSMSPPQTTLSSPGKTPDLSPGTNEFTSRDTQGKPGDASITPATTNPAQVMLDKTNALKQAALAIHTRYSTAAEALRGAEKVADQPMGGVSTDSNPISGTKKPEARPDTAGVGGPTPPASPDAVANFTNLDADRQHMADMPTGVSAAMLSAAKDDPPMDHAMAGASDATKAAAMRALLGTFGSGTKLGSSLRSRLAAMHKQADPLAAPIAAVSRPLGDVVTVGSPGMPPPVSDPRLTGSPLSGALSGAGAGGKSAPMDLNSSNQTTSGQAMSGGAKGMNLETGGDAIVAGGSAPGLSPLTSAPLGGGAVVGAPRLGGDPYSVANSGV